MLNQTLTSAARSTNLSKERQHQQKNNQVKLSWNLTRNLSPDMIVYKVCMSDRGSDPYNLHAMNTGHMTSFDEETRSTLPPLRPNRH